MEARDKLTPLEEQLKFHFDNCDFTVREFTAFKKYYLLPYLNKYYLNNGILEVLIRSALTKAEVESITLPYNKNKIKLSTFYNQLL